MPPPKRFVVVWSIDRWSGRLLVFFSFVLFFFVCVFVCFCFVFWLFVLFVCLFFRNTIFCKKIFQAPLPSPPPPPPAVEKSREGGRVGNSSSTNPHPFARTFKSNSSLAGFRGSFLVTSWQLQTSRSSSASLQGFKLCQLCKGVMNTNFPSLVVYG